MRLITNGKDYTLVRLFATRDSPQGCSSTEAFLHIGTCFAVGSWSYCWVQRRSGPELARVTSSIEEPPLGEELQLRVQRVLLRDRSC